MEHEWVRAEPIDIRDSVVSILEDYNGPADIDAICQHAYDHAVSLSKAGVGTLENKRVVSLELRSFSFESEYLRAVHPIPMRALNGRKYHERPCRNDMRCVALELAGGPGVPLRESLSIREDDRLACTGVLPKERQLCVLCVRYSVTKQVIRVVTTDEEIDIHNIIQPYRHETDGDLETYRSDCCYNPSNPGKWCGFTDPFVIYSHGDYRWKSGDEVVEGTPLTVWRVDQSRLRADQRCVREEIANAWWWANKGSQ